MISRLSVILALLGLGYLAVAFASVFQNPHSSLGNVMFVIGNLGAAAGLVAAVLLFVVAIGMLVNGEGIADTTVDLSVIGAAFPFSAFAYGMWSPPFAQFGYEPWHWNSPWILLVAFGALPFTLLFIYDLYEVLVLGKSFNAPRRINNYSR